METNADSSTEGELIMKNETTQNPRQQSVLITRDINPFSLNDVYQPSYLNNKKGSLFYTQFISNL